MPQPLNGPPRRFDRPRLSASATSPSHSATITTDGPLTNSGTSQGPHHESIPGMAAFRQARRKRSFSSTEEPPTGPLRADRRAATPAEHWGRRKRSRKTKEKQTTVAKKAESVTSDGDATSGSGSGSGELTYSISRSVSADEWSKPRSRGVSLGSIRAQSYYRGSGIVDPMSASGLFSSRRSDDQADSSDEEFSLGPYQSWASLTKVSHGHTSFPCQISLKRFPFAQEFPRLS